MKKKIRKRVIFVTLFIIAFAIYSYINIRGEYLQILGIGDKYVGIFKTNLKQRIYVFAISFAIIYLLSYITTAFIKKGLKKIGELAITQKPRIVLLEPLCGNLFILMVIIMS